MKARSVQGDQRKMVSDHSLINATYSGTLKNYTGRVYTAIYANNQVVDFAVNNAEHAKVYALEYGVRFLNSKLVSVRWNREWKAGA